jgi:hypothetical protein
MIGPLLLRRYFVIAMIVLLVPTEVGAVSSPFPRAVVISLKASKRRQHIRKEFKKHYNSSSTSSSNNTTTNAAATGTTTAISIPFTFVDAIDGKALVAAVAKIRARAKKETKTQQDKEDDDNDDDESHQQQEQLFAFYNNTTILGRWFCTPGMVNFHLFISPFVLLCNQFCFSYTHVLSCSYSSVADWLLFIASFVLGILL